MTGRALSLLAAALLSGAVSPSHAEENAAAPKAGDHQPLLAKVRDDVKSIDAEMANAIAIFRDEVQAGKEQDGWRADLKEAALQWVNDNPAIQPPQILPEDVEGRREAMEANRQRMKDFRKRPKLAPPASIPAAQLILRIETLQARRDEALLHYAGDLTAFAEDLWIKAEKPADLRPVAAAFAELNSLAPNYLAQTNGAGQMNRPPASGSSPSIVRQLSALQAPRRVEAFYAALFTAADEPLLFPDPKTDADGYTKMRVKWLALLRTNTPFLTRPRVAARVAQLDARYEAQRVAAGERLNALIVGNAPPAVFEPALNHFSIFREGFDANFPGLLPRLPPGLPPMGMGIHQMAMVFTDSEGNSVTQWIFPLGLIFHDYRDFFGLRPGSPPRQMITGLPWPVEEGQIMGAISRGSNPGLGKAYRQWLDYRSAEERHAAPAEMANLWEELRQGMSFLPSAAQEAIRKRRGLPVARETAASPTVAAPAPGPHPVAPKTPPVAELTAALQQPPASFAGKSNLEELSDRLQSAGAPVAKKAKEMLAIVEAEAGAKRIPEQFAKGLQWTLEHYSADGGADSAALLASTSMPVENAAIMDAARALDEAQRAAGAERAALKAQALREAARRSAELVRGAKSPEEIDAFLREIERFQKLSEITAPSGAVSGLVPSADFPVCIALMGSLREVLAVRPSPDQFVSQFMRDAMTAPDFAPLLDYTQRTSAILSMYRQAADAARDEYVSALIETKPKGQVEKPYINFDTMTECFLNVSAYLRTGSSNFTINISGSALSPFRAFTDFPELIASHRWNEARARIAGAREGIPFMKVNQALDLERLLAKLERQIPGPVNELARGSGDLLDAKLATVKKPSDLTAIAMELKKSEPNPPPTKNSQTAETPATELSKLAAAWSAKDLDLLTAIEVYGGIVQDAGITALRERIQREIFSQEAKAPELNQAPLANLPLTDAIDGLLAKLAAQGKWPEALRLLETRRSLSGFEDGPRSANSQMILAVRAYLAGVNSEAAGSWREAVGAYKAVLASTIDNMPVADAAARLKALGREHPKEVKAARPDPGYNGPRW